MMLRRRMMLMEPTPELYPIGTDIITEYIGRDLSGNGLFVANTIINSKTGEYRTTAGDYAASDIYMPIKPWYRFQKSSDGRLYVFAYYDANKNYISSIAYSDLQVHDLPAPPSNAAYARITTHRYQSNWGIKIIRIA